MSSVNGHNRNIAGMKLAIFGLGVSGRSALNFALSRQAQCVVLDGGPTSGLQLPKGVELLDQKASTTPEVMAQQDLIILSPGIPREHPVLGRAHQNGVPVINEVELALSCMESVPPVIAVTGTNGKTTTCSWMQHILEKLGIPCFLGGNIGTPLCELALGPKDVEAIILELSSFQLESISSLKPKVSCYLNLSMSHGERYKNVEDYHRAKAKLFDRPAALALFGHNHSLLEKLAQSYAGPRQMVLPPKSILRDRYQSWRLQVLGDHNLENLWFCEQALMDLGIEANSIKRGAESFVGVEHRCEVVVLTNPLIVNDAKSTNWQATKTALACLPENRKVGLIIGGQLRGVNDDITEEISWIKPCAQHLYFVGQSAEKHFQQAQGKISCSLDYTLEGAVKSFKQAHVSSKLDTLLLSSAFPSFDQFRSYAHRGQHFKELVSTHFTA